MSNSAAIYPAAAFRLECERSNEPLNDSELDAMCALLDTVFFASMAHEEGEATAVAVVVEDDEVPLEQQHGDSFGTPAWFVQRFSPLEANALELKKLARGVRYGRDALVATRAGDGWVLTGTARRAPGAFFERSICICAPRPGVVTIEGIGGQRFRYEAGQLRELEISAFDPLAWTGILANCLAALRVPSSARWDITELLREARMSGCGAMVVFEAPNARGTGATRVTFERPTRLAKLRADADTTLMRLMVGNEEYREEARDELQSNAEERQALVETFGRFAAIDGALVIKPGFVLVGAGAIVRAEATPKDPMPVPLLCRGVYATGAVEDPLRGGSRHRSAAEYAWVNKGSVVFCISADGPLTAFVRHEDQLLKWNLWLREF